MHQKRIVIVDDDPSILFFVGEILKGEGYGVQMADDGDRALEMMRTAGADLAVLDIDMPGMDGYSLLSAMREDEALLRIPVIFLTVKNSIADETQGLKAGVVDFISKDVLKPERIDILRFRVRNFFAVQENERLRGVLATIVSANHEINNPLMVIQGSVDLLDLKDWLRDMPEAEEVVGRIMDGCQQIKSVLERTARLTHFEVKPYLNGIEMLDLSESSEPEPDGN